MKLMMGIVMALTLGACAAPPAPAPSAQPKSAALSPASMNCIQNRGTLKTEHKPEGDVTYCLLPGGKRCEEWDMFRGNCPVRTVNVKMHKWSNQNSSN